jgi:hypothetical protein
MSQFRRNYKMDNVTFIKSIGIDGLEIEHAIIDRGNGEFTSMPKSFYDAQFAAKPKKTFTQSE